MEVVKSLTEIDANIQTLETYLTSADPEDQEFVHSLILRGRCFVVVVGRSSGLLFFPSRFVGYRANTRAAHIANNDKDGRITNPAITAVLGRELVERADLEAAYRQFCERIGGQPWDNPRKYWPED